jgi:hypothetical protein
MRIKGNLASWMQSGHAARAMYWLLGDTNGVGWPDEPEQRQIELFGEVLRSDGKELACEDLVYADKPMTDMIAAASDCFPSTVLKPSDFLSPFGLMITAKPLPAIEGEDHRSGDLAYVSASALTWACRDECIMAISWQRAHGLYGHRDLGDVFYQGLMPKMLDVARWDMPHREGPGPIAALRAMTALSRQPLVITDRPRIGQAARGAARKAGWTRMRSDGYGFGPQSTDQPNSKRLATTINMGPRAVTGSEGTGRTSSTPASASTVRSGSWGIHAATSPAAPSQAPKP